MASPRVQRARRLRRDETDAERKLWMALRSDQLDGLKFRRQHPVGRFTLDFYCESLLLAVEVDGGQHDERAAQDAKRTAHLDAVGIEVVRYWNNDVLQNLEGVWTHLQGVIERRRKALSG